MSKLKPDEIKELLDERLHRYNRKSFIENDPVSIPHRFSRKEDIEIAGFLTAIISWGKRNSIIKNADKLMSYLEETPYDFVMNYKKGSTSDKYLKQFVHRTFNGEDTICFIKALQHIYSKHSGLEALFNKVNEEGVVDIKTNIIHFRDLFFSIAHPARTEKHISNPAKNSSAKRINMYLRWMVRRDKANVDFGIWKSVPMSSLMLPLDVHTGNVSRSLGLLKRTQDDWKAVEEVTAALRLMDPHDPIKYDYALFGMGVNNDV